MSNTRATCIPHVHYMYMYLHMHVRMLTMYVGIAILIHVRVCVCVLQKIRHYLLQRAYVFVSTEINGSLRDRHGYNNKRYY